MCVDVGVGTMLYFVGAILLVCNAMRILTSTVCELSARDSRWCYGERSGEVIIRERGRFVRYNPSTTQKKGGHVVTIIRVTCMTHA